MAEVLAPPVSQSSRSRRPPVTISDDADALPRMVVRMGGIVEMDDEQLLRFRALNDDLRIEREANGDLIIMFPEGLPSGLGNTKLTMLFAQWAERDGTGVVVGPFGGFKLPNTAVRGPDLAWVRKDRLDECLQKLPKKKRKGFAPLCPDFVLELRSPTDSLLALQRKMEEYRASGARLGWLLDPQKRRVFIYRPAEPVEELADPAQVSGEPVLPGFVLDVRAVWRAMERAG